MLFFVFLLLAVVFAFRRTAYALRRLFGIVVASSLLLFGFCRTYYANPLNHIQHFQYQVDAAKMTLCGKILESKAGDKISRVLLHVQKVGSKSAIQKKATGLLMVFLKGAIARQLKEGQVIQLQGQINPIHYPANPYAFDYTQYLSSRGIAHQTFVDSSDWRYIKKEIALTLPVKIREFCIAAFARQWGTESNTFGVGAALILGDKRGLTADLRQAYTDTGAMHVLAVSGLHVGMLALAIRWLLGWIPWLKRRVWFSLMLEISSVWLFTLASGASPSALRSAVMFSFLLLAKGVDREANVWNTLASSAFVLLAWQPSMLFDIGFQLSYFAVGGIIYFHPLIYRLWYCPNRVLDYIWNLTAIGFAAQLVTAPLSLHYFHQFPLFFWLSGLIAVPLSSIILIGGLVLAALESLPFLGNFLGLLMGWSIDLLNGSMEFIQHLPYAVITGIWWNSWATLGVYLLMILAIIAGKKRRLWWVLAALSVLFSLGCFRAQTLWNAQHQRRIVCYHLRKASAVDVVVGRSILSISDSLDRFAKTSIQPMRWKNHATRVFMATWQQDIQFDRVVLRQGALLQVGKTRLLIVDGHAPPRRPWPKVDFILFRNDPRIYTEDLESALPQKIIIDGANRFKTRRWAKRIAEPLSISIHDTNELGAWVEDW
jgi:competence protein ComEC